MVRGSVDEQKGINARRVLASRLYSEGVSVPIIAKAFGTTQNTIYEDLKAIDEEKAERAVKTLERTLSESKDQAAPYVQDLLRLVRRIPQGE